MAAKPKRKTTNPDGAPEFKPTKEDRKNVGIMVAIGNTHDEIALVIGGGISPKTLRKHFDRELKTGGLDANRKVGKSMLKRCEDGDVVAQKWWSACRMGFKKATDEAPGAIDNLTINVNTDGKTATATVKRV